MGLFERLGEKVERIKRDIDTAKTESASYRCRSCDTLIYSDLDACPECGSEELVRNESSPAVDDDVESQESSPETADDDAESDEPSLETAGASPKEVSTTPSTDSSGDSTASSSDTTAEPLIEDVEASAADEPDEPPIEDAGEASTDATKSDADTDESSDEG